MFAWLYFTHYSCYCCIYEKQLNNDNVIYRSAPLDSGFLMHRRGTKALLLALLVPLAAQAQIWENGRGISLYSSAVKFLGDRPDRAAVGGASGLGLKYALSSYVQMDAQLGYGSFKPSLPGSRYKKDPADMHRTFLFPFTLGARMTPSSRSSLKPYVTLGAGLLFWDLRYLSGDKLTFWQDHVWRWGDRISGWRKNMMLYEGVGVELFLNPALSIDLQARFSSLIQMRRDNVGQNDINSQVLQGLVTVTWYWGFQRDSDGDGFLDKNDADPLRPEDFDGFQDYDGAPDPDNDLDGIIDGCDLAPLEAEDMDGFEDSDGAPDLDNDQDGIPDVQDLCATAAEDLDGFEDQDGCPDVDNDQDGIVDALDACPDQAEDFDGFEDENGCPDPDNDGDLLVDVIDKCPDQAETINGYMDEDGCPDADTDGDGIPDERDRCPNEAETMNGYQDEDGCPDDQQLTQTEHSGASMILQGVTFASGKAVLTEESLPILDETANGLILEPAAVIEIRGHTDNVGSASANQLLSERRAEAVRQYLIKKGVDGQRITALGFGQRYPIASNKTADGRAQNRRIEFLRVK